MLATDFVDRLKRNGVEVVSPVASVQDALELIGAKAPLDAALLDASLDEAWTSPIAAALERLGVPVVLITGQHA